MKDSTASLHAFCEALELSRALGVQLSAVSVAPNYEGDLGLTPGAVNTAGREPFQTVLKEALGIARDQGLGLHTFLGAGRVDLSILDLARNGGFDLILLGRRKGWALPWSAAARVVGRSPCDVLVIPEKRPLRFDRILCCATSAAAAPAQARSIQLAGRCNGRLTILADVLYSPIGVNAVGDTDRPIAFERIDGPRLPLRRLSAAVRSGTIDTLVLGEDHFRPGRILKRSTALRLLNCRPNCPVWIVRKPAQAN